MSEHRQSIIIRTGTDPRDRAEFSAIRNEINKTNHPSQPEVDWRLIESQALALFQSHGVDLHTASYYTLARIRLNGLMGFTEGCELLSGLIVGQWQHFWPVQPQARIDMLEWFNSRVGGLLRQLSFSAEDLRLVYRAERALQLITDKLQQVELKRIPRIENLLGFMQNVAMRLESPVKPPSPKAPSIQMPPLVYLSSQESTYTEPVKIKGEAIQEPFSFEPPATLPTLPPRGNYRLLKGAAMGVALSLLLGVALYWLQVRPMQQQLAVLAATAEGKTQLWLQRPRLETYQQQLERLAGASPLSVLNDGERLVQAAQQQWPNDSQQQAASLRWQRLLQARQGDASSGEGYYRVQQQLQTLSSQLIEQEKQRGGITISALKTAVYQMQNDMNRETSLEELLRQLSLQVRNNGTGSPALIKQIDDRWNTLLSRYYQLMVQADN